MINRIMINRIMIPRYVVPGYVVPGYGSTGCIYVRPEGFRHMFLPY
jgi:hypothetical protein